MKVKSIQDIICNQGRFACGKFSLEVLKPILSSEVIYLPKSNAPWPAACPVEFLILLLELFQRTAAC